MAGEDCPHRGAQQRSSAAPEPICTPQLHSLQQRIGSTHIKLPCRRFVTPWVSQGVKKRVVGVGRAGAGLLFQNTPWRPPLHVRSQTAHRPPRDAPMARPAILEGGIPRRLRFDEARTRLHFICTSPRMSSGAAGERPFSRLVRRSEPARRRPGALVEDSRQPSHSLCASTQGEARPHFSCTETTAEHTAAQLAGAKTNDGAAALVAGAGAAAAVPARHSAGGPALLQRAEVEQRLGLPRLPLELLRLLRQRQPERLRQRLRQRRRRQG